VRHRTALGLTTLLTAIFGSPHHAEAGLRFCNQGKFTLSVAVGYVDRQKGWVARGWQSLEPGECKDALSFALDNRYYYFHARGQGENSKVKYNGETAFCIETRKFRIYQADYGKSSPDECAKDGLRSEKFMKVDVKGKAEYTVNLGALDVLPSAGANPPATPGQPPATEPPPAAQKSAPAADPPAAAQGQVPAAEPPTASAEQPAPAKRPRASQQAPSSSPPEPSAVPSDGGPNAKACQRYPNLC